MNLQVERCVTVDVHRVRLYVKGALQKEADNLLVSKSRAEMKGNMVLVVLSIDCIKEIGFKIKVHPKM